MSLCDDCIKGVIHEGVAKGTHTTINGVPSYVAKPEGDYDKEKALIILTDIFGIPLINVQLIADSFAANGIYTVIPDILNDDPVPVEEMESGKFDLGKWFGNHGGSQTIPPVDTTVEGLKQQGFKTFAASGFCFGAKYVAHLAFEKQIKVAIMNHPSLLEVPTEIKKLKDLNISILWNFCEFDHMIGPDNQKVVEDIFEGKNYYHNYYEGASHGFAVRADLSKEKPKFALEDAFVKSVEFIKAHL